jgi:hypothetical protein
MLDPEGLKFRQLYFRAERFPMILTILSILIPIGSLFFIGLPITVGLSVTKEKIWVIAPFLGLAVIVLILQNLIYLGVPISKSYGWIWLGAGIAWIGLITTGAIKKLFPMPKMIWGIAFLAYLLHAIGLLILGPEYYVGHGWYDQLTYVSASQFLMDHALPHVTFHDLLYQPSAIKAYIFTTTNRIGEVIFQGFIACSLAVNAKTSFEPVILLLPFLTAWVMYAIAIHFAFTKRNALIIAFISASLPSLAMMHLESFISQALISPLLLLWPLILVETFEKTNWRKIVMAALLLAAIMSIYAEYTIIFCILSFFYLLITYCLYKRISTFGWIFPITFIACVLNVGFLQHFFEIAVRSAHSRPWATVYPWAHSLDALDWLWLGELTLALSGLSKIFFNLLSVGLLIFAYFGIGFTAYKKRDAVTLTLFLLLLLPVLIWLRSADHFGYQYYKLLISISALLPLGIALAYQFITSQSSREILQYCAILMAIIIVNATWYMVLVSTHADTIKALNRGVGFKLLTQDTREVQTILSALHHQDVLISWQDDFRHGDFINGWLSYFARNNRIWLTNPLVGEDNYHAYLAPLRTLPSHYYLLTGAEIPAMKYTHTEKIWGNKTYSLWRVQV